MGKKDATGLYSSNATLIVVPVSVLNQVRSHLIVPFYLWMLYLLLSSLLTHRVVRGVVGRRGEEAHQGQSVGRAPPPRATAVECACHSPGPSRHRDHQLCRTCAVFKHLELRCATQKLLTHRCIVQTLSKEHEQQSAAAEGLEKQTKKKKKKPKVVAKKRPIQLLSIRWHRVILDEGT